MSNVVVGVLAPHSTLMNTHWQEVAENPGAHAFRDGLAEAAELLVAARPDVVLIAGSNHFRGFWLDLMPAFTIGVGDCTMSGESGTPSGPLEVDVELARHLLGAAIDRGFDLAFSAKLQVDHGITHAVQYLLTGVDAPVVPLVVNVFAPPLPTLPRVDALGAVLREAIATDGAAKRVAVIGSGGVSHRLPFPRWDAPQSDDDRFMVEAWTDGRQRWQEYDPRRREIIRAATPGVNADFDHRVLDLLQAGRLGDLGAWSGDRLEAEGGNGANELRTWLLAAAIAGHAPARTLAYAPMPEWLTGMAVAVIDAAVIEPPVREQQERA
jgi:2,3-dihydroxyphenylpropionate 1,2-dioxygenase